MEIETPDSLWVYVLNEDETGEAWLLYPIPGNEPGNPLAPGQLHHLPGTRNERQMYWRISSDAEVEHFLILASREHPRELERELAMLDRPSVDGAPGLLTDEARIAVLRGVGRIVEGVDRPERSIPRIFESVETLRSRSELGDGLWARQVTFRHEGAATP